MDIHGLYVLPGLIDYHVHKGFGAVHGQGEANYQPDFKTETVSAAMGGVTTIITMATFGRSKEFLVSRMMRAKEIARRDSLVDFKISLLRLQ